MHRFSEDAQDRLDSLEAEVLQLRQAVRRLMAAQASRDPDAETIAANLRHRADEEDRLRSVFREAARRNG